MHKIKIATRTSALAMAQTLMVVSAIKKIKPGIAIEIIKVKTKADIILHKELNQIGGKALFTKQIDQLVLNGEADFAVHSAKDIETNIANELEISATLKRCCVTDCIITKNNTFKSLGSLPKGYVIGTSSPRRKAQILSINPNIKIAPLRGNINSRINKLKHKHYDAIILATAGLERLNITGLNLHKLDSNIITPASGQGIIAVSSSKTGNFKNLLSRINHEETYKQLIIERNILRSFGGDCHTPIAANCKISSNKAIITACVYSNNGQFKMKISNIYNLLEAERNASHIGNILKEKAKNFLCQKYY